MSEPKMMPSPVPPGECWTRSGRHAWESGPGPDRCHNCGAKRDARMAEQRAERNYREDN